jgi:Tol biopolymer transport system component
MHRSVLFAIVILMSTVLAETSVAQTLPTPQAVTDPKQIASKPNAQVEPRSLTIEKLYMTRQVGRPTWSPDGRSVAFISRRMADATHRQRPASERTRLVSRRQVDRLPIRLRRRRAVGHLSRLAQDRQGRQPHQHPRDRRTRSHVVARRPLPGISGQTKNIRGL